MAYMHLLFLLQCLPDLSLEIDWCKGQVDDCILLRNAYPSRDLQWSKRDGMLQAGKLALRRGLMVTRHSCLNCVGLSMTHNKAARDHCFKEEGRRGCAVLAVLQADTIAGHPRPGGLEH